MPSQQMIGERLLAHSMTPQVGGRQFCVLKFGILPLGCSAQFGVFRLVKSKQKLPRLKGGGAMRQRRIGGWERRDFRRELKPANQQAMREQVVCPWAHHAGSSASGSPC